MTTPEYPPNQPPYQPPYQPPAAPEYQPPAAAQHGPPAPQYGAPPQPYQPPAPAPYGAQPAPYGGAPAPEQLAPIPPGGAFPPGGSFPGTPMPPAQPPKKKGGAAKIISILGVLLVVIVVGAVKFGIGFLAGKAEDVINAPSSPWEDTPIDSYKTAVEAIELPAAKAVPGFTEAQVKESLETVKKALVAGRLDEKMLYDHDVTTLRGLFSDYGREILDDAFDHNFGTIVATRLADGQKLVDNGIRAKGTVTFKPGDVDGIPTLEVHSEFVWVYAFTGSLATAGDHLVYVEDKVDWVFPAADEVDPEYVGMYIGENSEFSVIGIDCDLADQDLIALGKLNDASGEATQGANGDLPPAADC